MTSERADQSPRDIVKLRRQVLREFVEANVLGGTILAVFYLAFQQRSLPLVNRSAVQMLAIAMFVAFVVVTWISLRVARPLVRWLQTDDGLSPAPQRLQIAVVLQPTFQSGVTLVFWALAALGFGLAQGITGDGFARRRFLVALAGTLVAGLATAAITYLRIEHTWRPWLPVFFRNEDPVRLPLPPADRLRTRLRWMFLMGTVVPLLTMAVVTSFRADADVEVAELTSLAWFLAIAGIFVAWVFSANVRHSITQPIHMLQEAMEQVEAGDFTVRVPRDRIDEFGRLQHGFNEMVAGLQARERVEDLFGRQVGGQVAEQILQSTRAGDQTGEHLGGEVRLATALFVDLAAFSTLAEFAQPRQLAQLLNVVFQVIVEAVEGAGGLVNKFQGDAVLAVFGAPKDDPEHAVHALEAAAEIAGRLESMRLDFGTGISTGEVFAGNIGSESRFEYTVVGDPVNEASRLQELTRELGRRVLLNGPAAESARASGGRAAAALVPVGLFVLRGKTHETEVFSLSPQMWRGSSLEESEESDTAAIAVPLEETG